MEKNSGLVPAPQKKKKNRQCSQEVVFGGFFKTRMSCFKTNSLQHSLPLALTPLKRCWSQPWVPWCGLLNPSDLRAYVTFGSSCNQKWFSLCVWFSCKETNNQEIVLIYQYLPLLWFFPLQSNGHISRFLKRFYHLHVIEKLRDRWHFFNV